MTVEVKKEIKKILWFPLSIILLVSGGFIDGDVFHLHHLFFIAGGILIGIGITKKD